MGAQQDKKYLVCPGRVHERIDGGQTHYVCAHALMALYGVHPSECLVYRPDRHPPSMYRRFRDTMIVLAPRHDGIYSLVSANESVGGV